VKSTRATKQQGNAGTAKKKSKAKVDQIYLYSEMYARKKTVLRI